MKKKIEMIWVLLVVLQTGSVVYLNFSKYLSATFVTVSILMIVKNHRKIKINKIEVVLFLMYLNLLFFSAYYSFLKSNFISINLITYMVKFSLIYFGLKIMNIEVFFSYLSKIILNLSIVSSVIFLMILFDIRIPITYGVIGEIPSYFYLLRTTGVDFSTNLNLIRNSGMFYEPGLYQVFLNITLMYYYLIKNNARATIFTLLIIITTLSPIGIAVALIVLSSKYWNMFKKISNVVKITFMALIILYFIISFVELKISTLSFQLRFYDIKQGLYLLSKNPFWGIGFENHGDFMINSEIIFGIVRKNSNGLISLFLQNGIFFGMYYLLLLKRSFKNKRYKLVGYIVLLVQLIAQPLYIIDEDI